MKNALDTGLLFTFALTLGSLGVTQSALADSAFSWGEWANEDMAAVMTSSELRAGTSLNHGMNCLPGACGLHYKPATVARKFEPSHRVAACEIGAVGKNCDLGPNLSQK